MAAESVFDHLAPHYDAQFSERPPARWLRNRVREKVTTLLPPESRVLDIGCGTGDDAVWLANAGHEVLATDVSGGMLAAAKVRAEAAAPEVQARLSLAGLDIAAPSDEIAGPFDCVSSNFGALNCVADLDELFRWVHERLAPGGLVAFTIMGRFCAWETLGFGLRGRFSRASRRWRGEAVFESGDVSLPVWYHSPAAVLKMADAAFELVSITGIGVFLPSTEFFRVCETRPRLMRVLKSLDGALADRWPFNRLGDHYLLLLRKVSSNEFEDAP